MNFNALPLQDAFATVRGNGKRKLVVFSDPNAGGVGGGIGGLLGSMGGRAAAVGALAGGVKFKEAQTAMTIADTRSGIQVAAAQGRVAPSAALT